MKEANTKEAHKKRIETLSSNLPQVSNKEERESHINIDYYNKKIYVYTSNSTVMSRMTRKNIEHCNEDICNGQVYSREYEFSIKELSKVFNVGLFK